MHAIYLVSDNNPILMRAVLVALQEEFPNLTFDDDIIDGVPGVRVHHETWDLMAHQVLGPRNFARGFMACLKALTK